MHSFDLSADSAISFFFTILFFVMLVCSTMHELAFLPEKHPDNRILGSVIRFSERQRGRLLRFMVSVYNLRYVTLFILCAMVVSTISPVSSLIEIEDNVLSKSCKNLGEHGLLRVGATIRDCKTLATADGYSYVDLNFTNTRNHFIQIALWPCVLTLYGFAIAGFISIARKSDDEPVEEAIEMLPHVHHILTVVFVGALGLVGIIQTVWVADDALPACRTVAENTTKAISCSPEGVNRPGFAGGVGL